MKKITFTMYDLEAVAKATPRGYYLVRLSRRAGDQVVAYYERKERKAPTHSSTPRRAK